MFSHQSSQLWIADAVASCTLLLLASLATADGDAASTIRGYLYARGQPASSTAADDVTTFGCDAARPIENPSPEQSAPQEPEIPTLSSGPRQVSRQPFAPPGLETTAEWLIQDDEAASSQKSVEAVDIDKSTCKPVPIVKHITIEGQPLLWLMPEGRRVKVVVDKRYFSHLQVLCAWDAQRRPPKKIGTYSGGNVLSGQQFVDLLIGSELLRCRKYGGHATVELIAERRDESGYRARLRCDEVFKTNSTQDHHYDFVIRIGGDGTIELMKE
jgi:hypothetical protein